MHYRFGSSRASHPARFIRFLVPALVICAAFLGGCDGNGGDDDTTPSSGGTGGTGSGSGGTGAVLPGTISLAQDQNYTATTVLMNPYVVPVAPESNLKIDFANLTEDIQGHVVKPAEDIDDVALVEIFNGNQAEVLNLLAAAAIGMDTATSNDFQTKGATSVQLQDFGLGGKKINLHTQFVKKETSTYLVVFQTGTKLGVGARAYVFLNLDPNSINDQVMPRATNGDQLTFTPTLSQKPLSVSVGSAPKIEFAKVTKDSAGAAVQTLNLDRLLIGFYEGKDVAWVQTNFLDLDQPNVPTKSWEMTLGGQSTADLSSATGRDALAGQPFTGFTSESGTWILGWFCSSCQNPAPPIVVQVVPQ